MSIFGDIAAVFGETKRINRTSNNENALNENERVWLDNLRKAADSGDIGAMFDLGVLYYQGKYVGYNPDMACRYWEAAAKRGHVSSMYNLGLLYMGDVSTYYFDDNKAGEWLSLAAKNGDKDAARILNERFRYSKWSDKWRLTK